MAATLRKLGFLVDFLNQKIDDGEVWESSALAASMITPVSHSLLSMPRIIDHSNENVPGDYLIELTRIAILIILGRLKQTFSFPNDELPRLQDRFRQLCLRHTGSELLDLELWAVTYVALIDQVHIKAYARYIQDLAEKLGVNGAKNILKYTSAIMCIERGLSLNTEALVSILNATNEIPSS